MQQYEFSILNKKIRIVARQDDADFEEKRPPERMQDDVRNLHAAAVKGKPWAVEKLKDRIRHFPTGSLFTSASLSIMKGLS